jgi:hypothetical protein
MIDEVTVVITSCNRPNLLNTTLTTFFKYNTYKQIKKVIIVEDSGINGCIDECVILIPGNIEHQIIYNTVNIGQIKSIDIAYSYVQTEYIFHCEDDWEFYDHGFIEKSLDILKSNDKIFTVWLREYKNCRVTSNGHPIDMTVCNNNYRKLISFKERTNTWNGFTFNPGLRRTSDCYLLMPYSKFIGSTECNCGGVEQALSNLYHKLGFFSVITLCDTGYVKHIGFDNPTSREY